MSNEARDFLGNTIAVGDTVAFPHSGGTKLVSGEVVSISAKQCRIKCNKGHRRSVSNFRRGQTIQTPEVTQRNHQHCIVVKEHENETIVKIHQVEDN